MNTGKPGTKSARQVDFVLNIPEVVKRRQEDNMKLIQQLYELADKYPDLRFSQILVNFGFVDDSEKITDSETGAILHKSWVDEYNREPGYVLSRVTQILEKMGKDQ